MKWFEFDTDFFENKFVVHTQATHGGLYVLAYIKLIALIYKYYDLEKPGKLIISWTTLQKHFNCYQKQLELYLTYFQSERKVEWERRGNKVWLYVPKSLERADFYTKKILRKKYGQGTDKKEAKVRTEYGIQYSTTQDKECINSGSQALKAGPLARLVAKSFNKLIRRGGE